ncbi:MAG: DUF2254 domain-containing protein [Thermoleophilia bacterium]
MQDWRPVYRLLLRLRDGRTRIWIAPAGAVVGAIALCAVAFALDRVIAGDGVPAVGSSSLDDILSVVATSMLAVATFSLGIMVAAFASAASTATPRATELVMADDGTRRAISAFVGSFVFAAVAKTALAFDFYGAVGRFALLVATLGVLAYLVARLVLWVRTMSTLGRMADTLTRIESATRAALEGHVRAPCLGGLPISRAPAIDARQALRVRPEGTGYVTHVDAAGLHALAERVDGVCHVLVRPGAYVDPATVLAVLAPGDRSPAGDGPIAPESLVDTARRAFVLGRERRFEQDPRFGLIVLREVAQRALSPAVNDPGTAIQAASIATSLLVEAARLRDSLEAVAPELDRVAVVELDEAELVRDGFDAIARDGADDPELAIRLQKLLAVVARHGGGRIGPAAREQAARALERSLGALALAADRAELAALHGALFGDQG